MIPISRRSMFTVLAVAPVVSLTAGCGIATDPDAVAPRRYVERVEVDSAAKRLAGEVSARAAAKRAFDFALQHGLDPTLVNPQRTTFSAPELIDPASGLLSTATLATWRQRVAQALSGDQSARDEVEALMVYGLDERAWRPARDGDVDVSQTITNPRVSTATTLSAGATGEASTEGPSLLVSFVHTGRLRYLAEGAPIEVVVRRDISHLMVQEAGEWRVAQFLGPYDVTSTRSSR